MISASQKGKKIGLTLAKWEGDAGRAVGKRPGMCDQNEPGEPGLGGELEAGPPCLNTGAMWSYASHSVFSELPVPHLSNGPHHITASRGAVKLNEIMKTCKALTQASAWHTASAR